jgi:hypothetical protein
MTKRIALIALLLVVVLGAGPGKGCKKDSGPCATFDGLAASTHFFPIMSWRDTVNDSDSYFVEALQPPPGGTIAEWTRVSRDILQAPDDGNGAEYAVQASPSPFATALRVVASCGETSDEIPFSLLPN